MDILMDTHVVWWYFNDDKNLSKSSAEIIDSPKNKKHISIASLWEVSIKLSINKLFFNGGIDAFIDAVYANDFALLEITPEHIKAVSDLPFIHRDPFDRMLVAQAIGEGMHIMTADANILKYDISTI